MKTKKTNPSANSALPGQKGTSAHRKAKFHEVARLVKRPPASGSPGSLGTATSRGRRAPSADDAIVPIDRESAVIAAATFKAILALSTQVDDPLILLGDAEEVLQVETSTLDFLIGEGYLPVYDGVRVPLNLALEIAELAGLLLRLTEGRRIDARSLLAAVEPNA